MSAPASLSVFGYPAGPHVRRHGPRGYTDYTSFKPWLRDEFAFRCVYCLHRERWEKDGAAIFSIDHVIAQALDPSRVCDYDNLVYACLACNSSKRDQRLPSPCVDNFAALLRIRADGVAEGLCDKGRRLVEELDLNRGGTLEFRRRLLDLLARLASVLSVQEAELLRAWFGYPDDLPDLVALRPPEGNIRPAGIARSYLQMRMRRELPVVY